MNDFSNTIKSLRKSKNLTQRQLGGKLGVTQQTVCKWESGRVAPEIENFTNLLEIFNVEIQDLKKSGDKKDFLKFLELYSKYQCASEKDKKIVDLILNVEN